MTTISNIYQGFNSLLSLQPLVMVLKKMIIEGKPGAKKLYQGLLDELEAKPELLQPMKDITLLHKHTELVETLLSTIFPPSTISMEGLFAVTLPFHAEAVYASAAFKKLFLSESDNLIKITDQKTIEDIGKASLKLAYDVILNNFYSLSTPITATSVHPFTDKESGLTKYFELKLNAQFVDVKCTNKNFALPAGYSPMRTLEVEELKEQFPLENFQFEGLMVIDVTEVTQEQVIAEIKYTLLNINALSDVSLYNELQQHVQSLIGLKDISIGITPFFQKNGSYLYTEGHYTNSLLFKNKEVIRNKDKISALCQQVFKDMDQPVLYQSLNNSNYSNDELLKYYIELGASSLVLCPLKNEQGRLIGLLEILSKQPGKLHFHHLSKVQPSIQLFSLALEKIFESLEMQIDKTIKEHFTAIQPSVEWKFTEAAFYYLQYRQISELAKMPNIAFADVYPLYGAIDIRNSSVERSNAIQLDMLEQLNAAHNVLEQACKNMNFPLLNEMQYRIEKYITAASDTLLSDDETLIYDFLQYQVSELFQNLKVSRPELKKAIDKYFNALDPQRDIIYHHRKDYEESINRINDVLDRLLDQEQREAQKIYPHYFERYVTDGLEFNIYIGQSIAPRIPFDEMYVRNLKLWQLTLLAKAARLSNTLEKTLPLSLQTTQLILAHSIPLSISFRRKERKFDVDGAYNIRYEIVKKRIDKVHIKDSEERLTQPGKVAVVYSQQKELTEYLEYIEFLQSQKLLCDDVEYFDLEDTQGISGLKAIRVDVNLKNEDAPAKKELSSITAHDLLKK